MLFSFNDPIVDFLNFLLPLDIICYVSIQFFYQFLSCRTGILCSCLFCVLQVHLVITQIETCHYVIEWILWFWSQDQSINTFNNVLERQSWWVVSVEDTMANSALRVHVAVVNWCDKSHFWSSEWVIVGELGVQQEQSIFIWSIFWT